MSLQPSLPFGAVPVDSVHGVVGDGLDARPADELGRTVSKTGVLTYRTLSGEPFRQPILTAQGIVVGAAVYVRSWDGESIVLRDAPQVFVHPTAPKFYRRNGPFGNEVVVPASLVHLEKLLNLPLVDVETRARAAELYLRWRMLVPGACIRSLYRKASSLPVEGKVHRQVGDRKIATVRRTVEYPGVYVTQVVGSRGPTPVERMAMLSGFQLKLEATQPHEEPIVHSQVEDVTEVEFTPLPLATELAALAPRELYSQQVIGVEAALVAKRLGLFFDMRVGKTMTAIVALKYAMLVTKEIDFIIVGCPRMNMYDPWVPELELAGFQVAVLDGTRAEDEERIRAWEDGARWPERDRPTAYVVNFERVASRWEYISKYWTLERTGVILDETSALKNPFAARSKAAHQLCIRPAYVLLLNGTPMEQGPHDLWSQLRCLDPHGCVTGGNFVDWAQSYLEDCGGGKFRVRRDPATRQAFEFMLAGLSLRYIRSEADQFSGKDKNFRYVAVKATQVMAQQASQVLEGFISLLDDYRQKQTQELAPCVLVTYGFLREISCGYGKFKHLETEKYVRVRHAHDPKLLWLECFLSAQPAESLVVYVNFDEQEQRLKERLDELNVSWASTAPKMHRVVKTLLKDNVSVGVYEYLVERFGYGRVTGDGAFPWRSISRTPPTVEVPEVARFDEDLVAAVQGRFPRYLWTTEEYVYRKREYNPQERANEIARFNRGDAHVFILKVRQGRGISLARTEAVEQHAGGRPTIVFLSPPWSLGDWDQAQDRCVATSTDGHNVCTMVYCLAVPGIEQSILNALRRKKEVQAELLKDAEREGYQSFVENLVDDMKKSAAEKAGEGEFDTDEMFARIATGVPPGSKLTQSLLLNKIVDKHGERLRFRNKQDVLRWLQQEPPAILTSHDTLDVRMNPDVELREAYFRLLARCEDAPKLVAEGAA